MTEPKCDFCNNYDKMRCKTLRQAHDCGSFRDYVDGGENADTEYVEEDGRRPGFDDWALGMAAATAERSRDPSTKVGAVIVRPDKSVVSVGYNGFPRSMKDDPAWWADRPQKYDRVIHAEMNAILQAKESVMGCTLYITHPPCKDCAKHVAAAGIVRIVCYTSDDIRTRFNIDRSIELLTDCGIEMKEVENGGKKPACKCCEGTETSGCTSS